MRKLFRSFENNEFYRRFRVASTSAWISTTAAQRAAPTLVVTVAKPTTRKSSLRFIQLKSCSRATSLPSASISNEKVPRNRFQAMEIVCFNLTSRNPNKSSRAASLLNISKLTLNLHFLREWSKQQLNRDRMMIPECFGSKSGSSEHYRFTNVCSDLERFFLSNVSVGYPQKQTHK